MRSWTLSIIPLFLLNLVACSDAAKNTQFPGTTGVQAETIQPQGSRVPVNATIVIQFPQALDENTIDNNSVVTNPATAGRVDYDAETFRLIYSINSNLLFNQSYQVSVASSVVTLAGAESVSANWQFTTTNNQFYKDYATAANTQDTSFFSTDVSYRRQILYDKDQLNSSNGTLLGIGFRRYTENASPISCVGVSVTASHTEEVSLNLEFGTNLGNARGSAKVLLDNQTLSIPPGVAGDYFHILFDQGFSINGFDNIVLDFSRAECSVALPIQQSTSGSQIAGSASAVTGTPQASSPNIRFIMSDGQNDLTINGTVSSLSVPFTTNNYSWRALSLFPASQLMGGGQIRGVAVKLAQTTVDCTYTMSVYAGHSVTSSLATNSLTANYVGTPTLLSEDISFQLIAGINAGNFVWIPFNTPFMHNGDSGIIVEYVLSAISNNAQPNCINPLEVVDSGAGNIYTTRSPLFGDFAEGSYPSTISTRLSFGSTAYTHLEGGIPYAVAWPFSASPSKKQILFRSDELNNYGNISKVAFRLVNAAVSETYINFRIAMGHTAKSTLSATDTFTSNMDDETLVYSGNFSVSGLQAGDWVEIPLTTAFNYNPSKNLVIQVSTEGGQNANENSTFHKFGAVAGKNVYSSDINAVTPAGATNRSAIRVIFE